MTIVISWVRMVGNTQELLLASDSRLSGLPGHVDYCQKLFPLSRDDSAIGFCGQTTIAYPFILHIINYVNSFSRAKARGLDIMDMRGRLLAILNDFRTSHMDPIDFDKDNMETKFIFSGWSWKHQAFEITVFFFDRKLGSYTSRPSTAWHGQRGNKSAQEKRIAVAGDYQDAFRTRLTTRLREKGNLTSGGFDMEPFEVLVDILLDKKFTDRRAESGGLVGGSPQLVKIYRYCSVLPFAVRWENPIPRIHLFGRPLLHYEKTTLPIIDPKDMSVVYPLHRITNS